MTLRRPRLVAILVGLILALCVAQIVVWALSAARAAELPQAIVVRVVDGDTVRVRHADGTQEAIRLIGLDTPETVDPRRPVQCYGYEATFRARALLTDQLVTIESDPSQGERDRYGRRLAYLYLPDGQNYAEVMIREGYGLEYTYRRPYLYRETFRAAQMQAREEQAGLWSPETCGVTA